MAQTFKKHLKRSLATLLIFFLIICCPLQATPKTAYSLDNLKLINTNQSVANRRISNKYSINLNQNSTVLSENNPSPEDISSKIDRYLTLITSPNSFSGSVLVAQKGKILLSKGYGEANYELNVLNTPQTKFRIGSITKPFTAIAVLQLQEKGLLNINDPIIKYIPDYKDGAKITIQHLLTHTSGICDSDSQEQAEPGTKFNYCNKGYFLLGDIIEKVSGKSYGEYVLENICKPLKMNNSGHDNQKDLLENRASGYVLNEGNLKNIDFYDMSNFVAGGNLYSTVEDLYLLDRALYTEQILTKESVEKLFTPFKSSYGYGWMIRKIQNHQCVLHYGHRDGFISAIYRFIDADTVIIVLTNLDHTPIEEICLNLSQIIFSGSPSEL